MATKLHRAPDTRQASKFQKFPANLAAALDPILRAARNIDTFEDDVRRAMLEGRSAREDVVVQVAREVIGFHAPAHFAREIELA
jgi:hypothetical protein